MLNDVRPSTLEGVKRLATRIGRERSIKHSAALDAAARAAKCQNYKHALRVLPSRGRAASGYRLFLTAYWYDPKNRARGRETLEVTLSKPLLDICSKPELRLVRGVGGMRLVASDHLVRDMLAGSQDGARRQLRMAERSLRFMEHTGLKPSADHRAVYPDGTPSSRLPGTDHATEWYDPGTGQFILVDEPYDGKPTVGARAAWAQKHGWHLRKSSWAGMYYPHHCDLWIATDAHRGYDFDALMAKVDGMPPPAADEDWTGESAGSLDVFVSPAASMPQDRRRAKARGTVAPRATATTIPYSSMFGFAHRRPAGKMPLAEHLEAGRMLKAVLDSPVIPSGAYQRMKRLRSTLEDWMGYELTRSEAQSLNPTDVYYGAVDESRPYFNEAGSRPGLLRILGRLRRMLEDAYPDCAPLREQLKRIDVAVLLIERAKAPAG